MSKEAEMKYSALAAAVVLVATQNVFAVEEHHPEGQGGTVGNAPAVTPAPTPAAPTQDETATVERIQANLKRMDAQLEQVRQATNPEERQRLLRAHMALMRENMQLMQGLAGGGAVAGPQAGMGMMGGQGGGMMMGNMMLMPMCMMPGYAAAASGPSAPGNLERRVELMQQMLQQVVAQHEQLLR